MSKLSVGIVGLPNVGKSTLFNALLRKQQAYAANFPFATIDPNFGVVPVSDERLRKLAEVVMASEQMEALPPEIPATVEFVDIAGLIAGAHKGEGLGNKFLAHIREVDAICHVVRVFREDNIVKEGVVSPIEDLKTIEMELALADLQTIEKQREPKGAVSKEDRERWNVIQSIKSILESGKAAREFVGTDEQHKYVKELSLLTSKPVLIVLNISEGELPDALNIEEAFAKDFGLSRDQVIAICAKVEEQLAGLDENDAEEYLSELGISGSGLNRLTKKAFATLGLITFLTAGKKEVRAWTIKEGIDAQHAAGVIHTDFEKNFIKADVVAFDDFVTYGGWKEAREEGKVRQEGRSYIVNDGDVIEFKIGS